SQAATDSSIAAANALGTPIKQMSGYNLSTSNSTPQSVGRSTPQSYTLGTCSNGVEFYAPDKSGDPNSTELQYFYDAACTQLARDIVRIYSSTGANSESVARTESTYAAGSNTASAVRTDTDVITNATFGQYGYPIAADGFDRVTTGDLTISGVKTIASDGELVMESGSGTNGYCGDTAGYNATGIASLNETFGWQGGDLSGGTRTVNGDGSVTWSATHAGTAFKGPIGSLSIATGTQNSACPITTPMFTLSGGTSIGEYTIPITATFKQGLLVGLTITNAHLANRTTLNVTTNAGVSPTNADFISGTVASSGGTTLATFTTDAFGDGTLTVTSTGKQYVITDWHVVR
ncbi:MAG TPA: hypothetical protein VIN40_08105, partial [Candidatus Tyrphobacter sp.]